MQAKGKGSQAATNGSTGEPATADEDAFDRNALLVFAASADPVPERVWAATLEALTRWPAPATIALERRLVRRGRSGLVEELIVSSDLHGLVAAHEAELLSLVRPIRQDAALRRRARPTPVSPCAVAHLHGLGARDVGGEVADVLLREAVEDLLTLPAGAGLGLVAWRAAARSEEPDAPLVLGSVGRRELHLVPGPEVPHRCSLRVWSPQPLPSAVLARLAAATRPAGPEWDFPEDAAAARVAGELVKRARPPLDLADSPAVAVPARVARLLASDALTVLSTKRDRFGRPWADPLPAAGAELGRVLTPAGQLKPFRLGWEERKRHTFVCGRTGAGKSELVARLAADDLATGRGLLLIDPHGDLADRVLGLVPPERADDVILIEPTHGRTAAIPVLDPALSVEDRVGALDDLAVELFDLGSQLYTSRWRRPARLLLAGMDALAGVESTLTGLDRLLTDEPTRAGLALALGGSVAGRRIAQRERFWWDSGTQRFAGLSASAGRFAFDHPSRWRIEDALRNQAIVIALLDLGRLGSVDTGRFGRALLKLAFNALTAVGRAGAPDRPVVSVIVDEAPLFADGAVIPAMLSQLRKFGGALTLCAQAPRRMGPLLGDILTNCGTVLAMELGRVESEVFRDRAGAAIASQIAEIPPYHAVAMLDSTRDDERPLVIHPLSPLRGDAGRTQEMREEARARYGRDPEAAARCDLERFAALSERIEDLAASAGRPVRHARPKHDQDVVDRLVAATLAGQPLPAVPDPDSSTAPDAVRVPRLSPLVVPRSAASELRRTEDVGA